jgi:hypothetical protein
MTGRGDVQRTPGLLEAAQAPDHVRWVGRIERIAFEPDDVETFDRLVQEVFDAPNGPALA